MQVDKQLERLAVLQEIRDFVEAERIGRDFDPAEQALRFVRDELDRRIKASQNTLPDGRVR